MKTILLSLCFLLAINLNAQPDSSQKIKPDSLYYKQMFFRVYPVIYNNGRELKKGEAKALFSNVPEAYHHYKKYINRYRITMYCGIGILVGLPSSVIGFDSGNRGLMAVGLTVAVVSLYSGIYFLISSDARLRKAIKIYNKSVRF